MSESIGDLHAFDLCSNYVLLVLLKHWTVSHCANFGEKWKESPVKCVFDATHVRSRFYCSLGSLPKTPCIMVSLNKGLVLKNIWIITEIRTTLYCTAQVCILFSMWIYFAAIHTLFWVDTLYVYIKQNNWRLKISVRNTCNNALTVVLQNI